ncbi:MAG: transposase, partial [bacterium]
AGLRELCLAQIPREKSRLHFALDVMAVRRMHSPTLNDRVFCHGAQREVAGKGIIIGLPYSILAYADERETSWAPAVHTERVKPNQTAVEIALKQATWVAEQLPAQATAELALDGGYGNLKFFAGMRGVKTFATARMRNDRVLYQLPPTPPKPEGKKKKRGRSRKYGPEFRFADPST